MSQNVDPSLGTTDTETTPAHPRLSDAAVETILTLDEIMSSARLVERTARICLRGDLDARYNELLEEISRYVDATGQLVSDGDQALADGALVNERYEELKAVRAERDAAMRAVKFRAMPDDEWTTFEKTHRDDKTGQWKDNVDFQNKLIARCAFAPTFTEAEVKGMRSKLTPTQMLTLSNAAFLACTTGGLDIPKLPDFSHALKPQQ